MERTDVEAICFNCDRRYVVQRKPQTGRRNYCPDCGPRIAARLRKRRHRDRTLGADQIGWCSA